MILMVLGSILNAQEDVLCRSCLCVKKEPLLLASSSSQDDNKDDKKEKNPEKDIYQWFKTYSEVVGLVEKKAFRSVDFSDFIQDSLKSAVSQVDAHSAFFTRDSYKTAMESATGEFSGIGISIIGKSPDDEALTIIDVVQPGPAQKAGLQANDKIVEVDGKKLKGMTTDEATSKLKGKIGTEVKIKVVRNKKPLEFAITRDIIKDQTSSCYHFPDHGIYYLSLKMFAENSAQQMSELLHKANAGKCKGIVLDLRRNPGGTLDSAIEMAGLFLEKGAMVALTKNKFGMRVAEYRTKTEPVLKSDVPIFILIDNFTASAGEILAGCLQYHSIKNFEDKNAKKNKRLMIFLVGVPTFGKGSVQEVIPISNGCALKLTTMLYYLPDEKLIQARGIEPDFLIKPRMIPSDELKWVSEMYGKESSLKHYITAEEVENPGKKPEEKKKEDEKEKSWEEKHREALLSDIQVQTCVNMINMLDNSRKNAPKMVKNRDKALSFLKQHYMTDNPVQVVKIK